MNRKRTPCGVWMMSGLAVIIGILLAGAVAVAGPWDIPASAMAPPPGFKASGSAEVFSPDTLWEKINGGAEFYLSAGFVSLTSQLYEAREDADTLVEVNIYHMGSLLNAFSVFSGQRRDDAQSIDVTPFAYQSENAMYLVHGPFYVEILWIQPLDGPLSLLAFLAQQFVRETPVKGEDLPLLALFPPENRVKGSDAMIASGAFGFEPLDRVFTAEYLMGQERSTAYISKRKTPAEARELAKGLHAYFKNFGGRNVAPNTAIQDTRMIEIMGAFELMFPMGKYLAGVHEAPSQKQAEKIADMLAASLGEKGAATKD